MINIPNFHPNATNSSFFFAVNNHVVALEEHIKQLQNVSANIDSNENTHW